MNVTQRMALTKEHAGQEDDTDDAKNIQKLNEEVLLVCSFEKCLRIEPYKVIWMVIPDNILYLLYTGL